MSSKVKNILAGLVSRKEFKTIKDRKIDGQLAAPVLKRFKEQCQTIVKNGMSRSRSTRATVCLSISNAHGRPK